MPQHNGIRLSILWPVPYRTLVLRRRSSLLRMMSHSMAIGTCMSPTTAITESNAILQVSPFYSPLARHTRDSSIGSNIGTTVAGFSLGSGASRSELYAPTAIYVDGNGAMYILDSYNYRVLFWRVGEPLGTVIINGRGSGTTFDRIGRSFAMFVDGQQNIYVSDNANSRVTKWFNGNNTISLLVRPKSQDEREFETIPCVGGWREWCWKYLG